MCSLTLIPICSICMILWTRCYYEPAVSRCTLWVAPPFPSGKDAITNLRLVDVHYELPLHFPVEKMGLFSRRGGRGGSNDDQMDRGRPGMPNPTFSKEDFGSSYLRLGVPSFTFTVHYGWLDSRSDRDLTPSITSITLIIYFRIQY